MFYWGCLFVGLLIGCFDVLRFSGCAFTKVLILSPGLGARIIVGWRLLVLCCRCGAL